ncbi:MAG: TRAP transporter substrate-binding protein [Deltaproteobacteria bacterium]|nr:TRAP transporter substrate-binding protein [Deltaproteobacteria bacterium]
MKKRFFWISLVSCALLVVSYSLAGPAWAGFAKKPKYILNFGHCVPEDHPYHIGAVRFQEAAAARSDGELKIEIFPNFQLGSEQEQYKACQMGTQDIALGAINNAAPFWPPFNVFIMPYLFRSLEHAWAVADGPVGKELKEKFLKNTGLRTIALFDLGFRSLSNSKRPITKPADLKGVLFRVPKNPVMVETTKAMGADAIPMAWSEVFNALKQGVVDGQDTPPAVTLSMKFYEARQKYYSLTKHFYAYAITLMSEKKYQSLPPHIQKALDLAARDAELYQRGYSVRFTEGSIAALEAHGMKVNDIPDRSAFVKAVEPVWAKFTKEIPEVKVFGDKIRAVPTVH